MVINHAPFVVTPSSNVLTGLLTYVLIAMVMLFRLLGNLLLLAFISFNLAKRKEAVDP